MIVQIQGKLLESEPFRAVIATGGLSYEVHIPLTTAEKLPPAGNEVTLHTLQVFRENDQALYGFAEKRDREFFRILTEKVSGIGPRIALNLLSRLAVSTLQEAIREGNVALLSQCPGIGKKTAERLVVELRDYLKSVIGPVASSENASSGAVGPTTGSSEGDSPSASRDALAALMALGYKLADADKAVRQAQAKLGSDANTESLVRAALGGK